MQRATTPVRVSAPPGLLSSCVAVRARHTGPPARSEAVKAASSNDKAVGAASVTTTTSSRVPFMPVGQLTPAEADAALHDSASGAPSGLAAAEAAAAAAAAAASHGNGSSSSSGQAPGQQQQQDGDAGLLVAKHDNYDGVIIDPEALPEDPQLFTQMLLHSLQVWRSQGVRGVWLHVPLSRVALIAPAVQQGGFKFHHAEEGHAMLVHWLPDAPCTLPPNASHQVGVGAFVLNEHREVLVVQERSGVLRGMDVWKIPTGLVHAGEDVVEAAEREVLEETGVRGQFRAVLAVRQAHGVAFGKSDMFFVCAIHPEPGQPQPTPQESEIAAVRWIPLDEYLHQNFQQGVPVYDQMRDRCRAYAEGRYRGLKAQSLDASLFRKRTDLLMWGDDDVVDGPGGSSGNGNGNGGPQQKL